MHFLSGAKSAALLVVAMCAGGQSALAANICPAGADAARCRVEEINALDRQVTQAYSAAAMMLDVNGRQKLRRDQDLYDSIRKSGQSGQEFDLPAQITMRLDFLRAIREPRGKWVGHWASASGTIDISADPNGTLKVRASAMEPVAGAWMCEFDDTAAVTGSTMIVGATSARMELGGPNEGWILMMKMVGDVLTLDALPPQAGSAKAPFCSNGGTLNGTYFAQAAAPQRTSAH